MSVPPDLGPLIAGTAAGDRVAFGRLYEATSAKLLGVVLRIVRDRAQAEDVVQDAYVKIWQGAGSYSAEAGKPLTWMMSIARYRAIDIVRRRTESPAPVLEDGSDWFAGIADPTDHETAFVDADRLRRCLDRLDEPQRRCFLEAYRDGYSRDELAERFTRPVNTIKTWLHRSAGALRGCLEET